MFRIRPEHVISFIFKKEIVMNVIVTDLKNTLIPDAVDWNRDIDLDAMARCSLTTIFNICNKLNVQLLILYNRTTDGVKNDALERILLLADGTDNEYNISLVWDKSYANVVKELSQDTAVEKVIVLSSFDARYLCNPNNGSYHVSIDGFVSNKVCESISYIFEDKD